MSVKTALLSSKTLLVGAVIIVGFIVTAIISALDLKLLTPYDPNKINFALANLPPSSDHLFGTDSEGRDVFTRVLAALPNDVAIPYIIAGASALIGGLVGMVSGYVGGLVDEGLMRFTDIFLAFPGILLALAISTILGQTHVAERLYFSMIALIVVNWPIYARLVRSQVLQVRGMPYITLAKAAGLTRWEIMRRHIIPNILSLVIVYITLDMGTIILFYSILAFFGLGAPPPTPELGRMVYDGLTALPGNWWSSVFPALTITLMAVGFSLFGEGLRDYLDPRGGDYVRRANA
ncbi:MULTISPECIES: ABC transporter permease [Metallosphaera]|uniref:ABC transporter permease n=1 Tax=Metallosphaera TaxID=41980 RepID=UPI001F055146|nr:ABC transporter permease [Metallosphaera sedula]MCH1771569.1 ABC transporter permease [Metallosphaera sedula]MCP6728640.1 ABC transporter permease [Metallosphaera sedula]